MFSVSRTYLLILEFLIFTDFFLHLHLAWFDRFYILPSLDFSSNTDFTNFHCFAWQVIGTSCNLHNISIRRNSNWNSFLFQDEIQTRIFNIDEEQLCYGRPNVIFPKKAKNLNDEWVWVVNIDNYTQSVEVGCMMERQIIRLLKKNFCRLKSAIMPPSLKTLDEIDM